MKKLIALVIIGVAVYYLKSGIPTDLSFLFKGSGAFDEQGNPLTLLFVHNQCGSPCDDAIKTLKKRRINFTLYNIDDSDENRALWKNYNGVNKFPNLVVGHEKAYGSYTALIASALALNYGESALTRMERYYMKKHFYDNRKPKLVMYGATWCPYCKKMREALQENSIDFVEINVDKSSQRKSMTKTLNITGFPLMYLGYKRLGAPDPRKVVAMF